MTITLTNPERVRCMKSAAAKGCNPYDTHSAYAKQAARQLADKARRMRDRTPYPFHVVYR